ncbi:ABC transporter permease [Anaerobacillus isosaccharinicus]|uniref:ABC transporter permease subunit n=1 Tax=Anaerobacillus isosaccharinicus TaxID=1532552 RepID=A0A1S2MFR0_9BACI|nr:ABC transporter permease subunit [Anaerobacillus isosaccharinicus]MBA5584192.1 ABC transporter permease subunit [Anaerobacillus isosaccharinicus]QOY37404.1 ABC transporter permease subunit [Anaerobacillus isosaccharinicus]
MIRQKSFYIGMTMLVFIFSVMIIGPYLPFIDKEISGETLRMGDEFSRAPFPPSLSNPFEPFGTDTLGRDLLSLIVIGTKDTLILVFLITVIRYAVAIPLALGSINQRGPAYWLLTSWNSVFSALPTIFSAVLLMNLPFVIFSGNRVLIVIIILAFIEVGRVAYIIQQEGYMVTNELYVKAGITIGNSRLGLFSRYYLPALLPSILTNFFLDLGKVLLLIGQLGIFSIFIEQSWIQLAAGSGEIQNISYNWASILGESRGTLSRAPWITFFPALAITFTIISFFFIGEGLRAYFSRKK